MKIRRKLVSNSSSSSFILFLKKKPESIEETKEMFFPNDEVFGNPFPYGDEPRGWPIMKVARTIFKDLKEQTPLSKEELIDILSGQLPETTPSWSLWKEAERESEKLGVNPVDNRDAWKEIVKELKIEWKLAAKELTLKYLEQSFKKVLEENLIFKVTYSDDHGSYYCALEHGNTFRSVKHIEINNH